MPRILIDNTPPEYVFQDGNQLTDGMANFSRALIQAPLAVAQIRKQQDQQDLSNVWRQSEMDRQQRLDDQASLWHQQSMDRQDNQDAIAHAGLGIDVPNHPELAPITADAIKTRGFNQQKTQSAAEEQAAQAELNKAHAAYFQQEALQKSPIGQAISKLFGLPGYVGKGSSGSGAEKPTAATLKAAHELADSEAQRRGVVQFDELGKRQVKDPTAWNTILRESYALHGIQVPDGWNDPANQSSPSIPGANAPAWDGRFPDGQMNWYNPADLVRNVFNNRTDFTDPNQQSAQNQPSVPPTGQDVQNWLTVLRNPSDPRYGNSIKKLRRWQSGVDDQGNPKPELKQWAQSVIGAMQGPNQQPVTGK